MLFLLENTLRLAVPSKKDTHGRTEPATDPASFLFRRKEIVPLLFFLEEKKQKKIICGAVVSLRSCCFRQHATQNGRFIWKPSVFLYNWVGCAGNILFSERKPPPQCLLFLFFKKRKRSPSFLFRRKNRSACAGSAAPQTDGRRHILRCRRSEYHSGYASLLRLVFARVRRACASAFPCKPTTQKKINCGAAFLLCSCRFRQRAAQNGRFTYEPSVFLFRAGHAGKHLFTDKSTAPQCLLFLFFKKRNRSPSFLFRRKEIVPL